MKHLKEPATQGASAPGEWVMLVVVLVVVGAGFFVILSMRQGF